MKLLPVGTVVRCIRPPFCWTLNCVCVIEKHDTLDFTNMDGYRIKGKVGVWLPNRFVKQFVNIPKPVK